MGFLKHKVWLAGWQAMVGGSSAALWLMTCCRAFPAWGKSVGGGMGEGERERKRWWLFVKGYSLAFFCNPQPLRAGTRNRPASFPQNTEITQPHLVPRAAVCSVMRHLPHLHRQSLD